MSNAWRRRSLGLQIGQRLDVRNGASGESREIVATLEHRDDALLRMARSERHQLAGHPHIIGFNQRKAAEQILTVSVKARGNKDQLRLEVLERRQPLAFKHFGGLGAAAAGG